jgi:methylmalonyl-CoA mutase cobalamin-binding subunit
LEAIDELKARVEEAAKVIAGGIIPRPYEQALNQ